MDTRQTFGKVKNKFLYRCYPDDRSEPTLVPFEIPPQFEKKRCSYYVLVSYVLPVGILMANLGEVDEPTHFYEYLLYCKNLHVSQRQFHQKVLSKLKNVSWDLPVREARVFTIDGPNSIYLDDGFSVDDEKVSVYIAHVPYVLEKLGLWGELTTRISSIYFPDKQHPLLPGLLATLCSLNSGTQRPCLVLDIYLDGHTEWSQCTVNIHKNYTYENVEGKDFQILMERSGCKDSHELVHKYMTLFNAVAGLIIEGGIYLNVHKPEELPPEWLPVYMNHYSTYEPYGEYAQLTSPIRRLVDIINMVQLTKQFGAAYSYDLHAEWYPKLDTLNIQFRAIRKAQNTAKLLDLFERNRHQVFEGIVWDQKVYLKDIGIMMNLKEKYENYSKHNFQIFVFHDEAFLNRKIRLQKV